ncbi:MAG TPA: TrkH family potassium uptake protein [Gammaproteobacteria bacterium]|nr:TrkH family potassium uptake protein [Gammaproteobacteria bacterium]
MTPVLRGVGILLHVPALMALLSLPVAWALGEPEGLLGFAVTAAASLAGGQLLFWSARGDTNIQRHHAMLIAALAWLLVPLAGTLPFLLAADSPGADPRTAAALAPLAGFANALFESVSGFTATGLTMAPDPAGLPAYIQWWRSFTEWVGGLGVVVLLLAVLPPGRSALHLYFSEAREERILPSVKSTVRTIWAIYLGYTVAGVGLLYWAGAPPWVALNHGMTAIATGGFSVTNGSLAGSGTAERAVYLLLMVLGAVSFAAHYRVIRQGDLRGGLWGSAEARLFLALLAVGAVVLGLEQWHLLGAPYWMDSAFQWVSALTTAGFATVDVGAWHPLMLLWLILAMLVGAMAGSTGGGLKMNRTALLLKNLAWNVRGFRRTPHEVVRHRLDSSRLSEEDAAVRVKAAGELTVAYLLLWLASVILLLHMLPGDTGIERVFFETASAQGNVGLSAGLASPSLPLAAKLVLMAQMWMGRLEIFPVMVLLAWAIGRE